MKGVFCTEKELIDLRFGAGHLDLSSTRKQGSDGVGTMRSPIRGRGVDFAEVRSYQVGDDSRNIDWRVTARRGRVHTKVFIEERDRPVIFLVDQRRSMFFGTREAFKSVIAAQAAARLAWGAIANGDKVGGLIFSDDGIVELRPKAGKHGVLPIIKALAASTRRLFDVKAINKSMPLATPLQHLWHTKPRRSVIFVLSDFNGFDDEAQTWLSRLRQSNDVLAFHVFDAMEKQLPLGVFSFTNDESTAVLDINRARRKLLSDAFGERQRDIKDRLFSFGAGFFELATDSDPKRLVI